MSVTRGGTHYGSVTAAARAYAATVLPVPESIGADESAVTVARETEAYWYAQAVQSQGSLDVPEGLDEDDWRHACRGALEDRILDAREGGL